MIFRQIFESKSRTVDWRLSKVKSNILPVPSQSREGIEGPKVPTCRSGIIRCQAHTSESSPEPSSPTLTATSSGSYFDSRSLFNLASREIVEAVTRMT